MEEQSLMGAIDAELVDERSTESAALTAALQISPAERRARARDEFKTLIREALAEETQDERSTPEARAEYWTSIPANTRRGYEADWLRFCAWCQERNAQVGLAGVDVTKLEPAEIERAFMKVDPETVAVYAQELYDRGLKLTTITRAIAAIGRIHQRYGRPKPTRTTKVRDKLAHLRRKAVEERRNRTKKANAVTREHYVAMMETLEPRDTLRQLRNAAILTTWFNVGLRRDEVRKLRREDVRFAQSRESGGLVLVVHIYRSKTDQDGAGVDIAVQRRATASLCANRAIRAWLEATEDLDLDSGIPLFPLMRREHVYPEPMSLRSLDLLVKNVCKAAGFADEFSTHSFRAGCATFLLDEGVDLMRVQDHLRHKDSKTTRGYYRPENRLDRDPMKGLL